ncbi:type 1 glutamine amidotransferase domain-containing protein [Haliangium ochraceum]|uniref:ThiJ/PfpI domain protein n=1 Tax=Haliangium ochraceum (strain DSM 14365 / JCM 11303 / SMP-2) TaxID=502025 RepID=D0LNV9_HALO1|nr:type 1 glutamine amidotransferase domain-containing protein [Haliangium ochraceum]ACY18785.1 ThiJ/PfpI domain protein [Haliangium ochraceum DSM 14365]
MTDTNTRKRILIALTSHDALGDTGRSTGFYLSEVSHPYYVFTDAGYEVDFVSPKGGAAPMDGVDRDDPKNAAFLDDAALMKRVSETMRPEQVEPQRYAAIFLAGGHGTMWDFPDEEGLQRLTATIYEAGGVAAAVCHGPAGLVNVRLSDDSYLVAGKRVAGFTNEEEQAVGLSEVVPFHLETRLIERGAKHEAAPKFQAQVVSSERLVTGQNPASASGVAEAMLTLLDAP